MVECGGLENRFTGNPGDEGSNPSSSASFSCSNGMQLARVVAKWSGIRTLRRRNCPVGSFGSSGARPPRVRRRRRRVESLLLRHLVFLVPFADFGNRMSRLVIFPQLSLPYNRENKARVEGCLPCRLLMPIPISTPRRSPQRRRMPSAISIMWIWLRLWPRLRLCSQPARVRLSPTISCTRWPRLPVRWRLSTRSSPISASCTPSSSASPLCTRTMRT